MSDSSTAVSSLFDVQRTVIDRTIDAQETINRQGIDLTRRAVKPLVDATPGSGREATDRVDDAFDRLDETQAELLADARYLAETPVDTSERTAEWAMAFFDRQADRLQGAGEAAEETTGEVAETTEETAAETAETAEDAAETPADATEGAVEETVDAAAEAADSSGDVAEAVADDFQAEIWSASEEFETLADVDETAVEALADTGIETLADLADARAETVADVADTTEQRAEEWVDAAVAHEGEGVSDLEGVGETYTERLADAGIRTQAQLARTSAHEVAEAADVSEDQAVAWVQRARDDV